MIKERSSDSLASQQSMLSVYNANSDSNSMLNIPSHGSPSSPSISPRPTSANFVGAGDVKRLVDAEVGTLREQNAQLEKRTVALEAELADMKNKYAELLARVAALETSKK
jgi:hypothetical protein